MVFRLIADIHTFTEWELKPDYPTESVQFWSRSLIKLETFYTNRSFNDHQSIQYDVCDLASYNLRSLSLEKDSLVPFCIIDHYKLSLVAKRRFSRASVSFSTRVKENWFEIPGFKEARSSFSGLRVEVLKLQSRIEDELRSPAYYKITGSKLIFLCGFQAETIAIATV